MRTRIKSSLFLIIFLLPVQILQSQQKSGEENFIKKNFVLSGDIVAYTEYFKTNNSFARRPPYTGRIIFRPTLSLFGLFQIPFEFLISTEGSSARQDINQYGINPRWSWGSIYLGDYSMEFSRYTLSGIRIRGVGLELFPGKFRFSIATGLTKRAVLSGAQDGSYKRFMYSAKIGYGDEASSYIDLMFVRVKDEITSLEQNLKSITILTPNGQDILEIGSMVPITWNSYGISGPVKIELSRDGGFSFETIQDEQPNYGLFNWVVTGPNTNQALIKISSKEDTTIFDLSDGYFSIGSGVQTVINRSTNPIINYNSVTPQENLIVGSKGKISLFSGRFSFEYDGGGSVYTRDLRSKEISLDSVRVPSFVKNIYKPRIGTNADFAFNTQLSLRLKYFTTRIGFRRIQPGYYSLGVPSLISDIQEISVMNYINFSIINLNLTYSRQNDNLLRQKIFTTFRDNFGASLNLRLSKRWFSNVSGNYLKMNNDSDNDSTKIVFNNLVLSFSNNFNFDPKDFLQNISLNYSFQNSNNASYMIKNNTTQIHSINLNFGFKVYENLNSSFSTNFINTSLFDTLKYLTHNYSLNFQHKAFSNKLITSLNFSSAFSQDNSSFRTTLSSGFSFTKYDNLSLTIAFTRFNGRTFRGGSFNEFITSLSYNRRF